MKILGMWLAQAHKLCFRHFLKKHSHIWSSDLTSPRALLEVKKKQSRHESGLKTRNKKLGDYTRSNHNLQKSFGRLSLYWMSSLSLEHFLKDNAIVGHLSWAFSQTLCWGQFMFGIFRCGHRHKYQKGNAKDIISLVSCQFTFSYSLKKND